MNQKDGYMSVLVGWGIYWHSMYWIMFVLLFYLYIRSPLLCGSAK